MMQLELATAEYIGARAQQQDLAAAIALKTGALLVLADGLGGHESGAEASRIVVDTFREAAGRSLFDDPSTRRQALMDTVERANARIGAQVDPAHGHRGMASTAVAAVVADGEVAWVSVGDSHLYVWRGGRLAKLNEDHSQAGLMIKSGQYTADDPEVQAVKSVLVSALTGRKLEIVDLPERTFKVENGDVLMLASDGLNTLDDDEIGDIVGAQNGDGAVRLSTVLLETVRSRRVERQDNTTVAVARVLATSLKPAPVEDPAERTVTHQVTVPTELAFEPQTERAAPGDDPGDADDQDTSRTVPVTRPAPSEVAAAMAKAAGAAPAAAPAAAKPIEALASSTMRTDPLPNPPGRPRLEEKLEEAAAAAAAKDAHGNGEPPVLRSPSVDLGAQATPRSRGFGRAVLGLLLLWLAAGVAALAAIAAYKPEWLGDWLPALTATEPEGRTAPSAGGTAGDTKPAAAKDADTKPAAVKEAETGSPPKAALPSEVGPGESRGPNGGTITADPATRPADANTQAAPATGSDSSGAATPAAPQAGSSTQPPAADGTQPATEPTLVEPPKEVPKPEGAPQRAQRP